jgi:broad specificity phosphatase PhoE
MRKNINLLISIQIYPKLQKIDYRLFIMNYSNEIPTNNQTTKRMPSTSSAPSSTPSSTPSSAPSSIPSAHPQFAPSSHSSDHPIEFPVIFLRHGHATHNEAVEKDGEAEYEKFEWKDAEMTSKGFSQVDSLVSTLITPLRSSGSKICAIYSSPLTRCIQTANIIQETLTDAPTITLADNLIERQGKHPCNWRKEKNELVSLWDTSVDTSYLPTDIPIFDPLNVETDESIIERMNNFMQFILHDLNNRRSSLPDSPVVLISTHHEVLKTMFNESVDNGDYLAHKFILDTATNTWRPFHLSFA